MNFLAVIYSMLFLSVAFFISLLFSKFLKFSALLDTLLLYNQ